MPPEDALSLPFITREMLKFEHGAKLQIRVALQDTATRVLRIRGGTRDGVFTHRFEAVVGDGTLENFDFDIPDFPLFVTLESTITTHYRGVTYARLFLLVNGDIFQALGGGWISFQSAVSWPQVHFESENATEGQFEGGLASDPAAGAEVNFQVANQTQIEILALRFTFATDANAADRRPHVIFIPANINDRYISFGPDNQTASLTREYTFSPFGGPAATLDNNDVMVDMPRDVVLGPLGSIRTETTNIQVGDQYTNFFIRFRQSVVGQ